MQSETRRDHWFTRVRVTLDWLTNWRLTSIHIKINWQSPEKVSTKVQNKVEGVADTAKTLPSLSENKSLNLKGEGQQTLKS